MYTLNYYYDYAKKRNLKIKRENLGENLELKGLCIYNFKKCNIYINSNILSETEEKCILAEEIGHYETGITYNLLEDQSNYANLIRSRNEFRAKKWAIHKIIPFNRLKGFLGTNLNKYEVAKELDVTVEFIELAYNIYEPKIKEYHSLII